jgi:hydroxypyruvate isomerase
MPRFAANLSLLFTEVPFLERFERAAAAGFRAVEVLFPYAWDAHDIRAQLDRHGLQLVLHNLPPGDWDSGDRGMACDPQRVDEFRAGVAQALHYARVLGTPQLHCMSGLRPAGASEAAMRQTLVENLCFAAAALQAAGLRLLIEPINAFDMPGYYLHRTEQAI